MQDPTQYLALRSSPRLQNVQQECVRVVGPGCWHIGCGYIDQSERLIRRQKNTMPVVVGQLAKCGHLTSRLLQSLSNKPDTGQSFLPEAQPAEVAMEEAVRICARRKCVAFAKLVDRGSRPVGRLCVEQDNSVLRGIKRNDMCGLVGDGPDLTGIQIHANDLADTTLVAAEKGDLIVCQPTDGTRIVKRIVVGTDVIDARANAGGKQPTQHFRLRREFQGAPLTDEQIKPNTIAFDVAVHHAQHIPGTVGRYGSHSIRARRADAARISHKARGSNGCSSSQWLR